MSLRILPALAATMMISVALAIAASVIGPVNEAISGHDTLTNGLVDQTIHDADRTKFEERETIASGLGPIYNAQSCADCHQSPVSGGTSQISVVRAGHIDPATGSFVAPPGGSLMHAYAIDPAIDVRIPALENIRSRRITPNALGDGYVEAIDDSTLISLAKAQREATQGRIAGAVVYVPVLEAATIGNLQFSICKVRKGPADTLHDSVLNQNSKFTNQNSLSGCRVGRFGWKDQHASLLSFAADSYFYEEGMTNRLFPTQNTALGKSLAEYDTIPSPKDERRAYHQGIARNDRNYVSYIDVFAQFIRATKVPPRDLQLAATPAAQAGAKLFEQIGCGLCHVSTLKTAPAGTMINGGQFQVPEALGDKIIHPYSDFLLHDIGTGDGIVQNGGQSTANKMRTAPLWGLRTHKGLMHDGASLTRNEAILRHGGEAKSVIDDYRKLTPAQRKQLLTFLDSL
jgi:CxxC motif-containing protein (DUF1111 family)